MNSIILLTLFALIILVASCDHTPRENATHYYPPTVKESNHVGSTDVQDTISLEQRWRAYRNRVPKKASLVGYNFTLDKIAVVFDTIPLDTAKRIDQKGEKIEIFKSKNLIIENHSFSSVGKAYLRINGVNYKKTSSIPKNTSARVMLCKINSRNYLIVKEVIDFCAGTSCWYSYISIYEQIGEKFVNCHNNLLVADSPRLSHYIGDFNNDGIIDCVRVKIDDFDSDYVGVAYNWWKLSTTIDFFTLSPKGGIIPLTDAKGAPCFIKGIPKIIREENFNYKITDSLYVVKSNWFEPLR